MSKELTAQATNNRKDAIRQLEKQLQEGTKPIPSNRNSRRQDKYFYNNNGAVWKESKDGKKRISAFKLSAFDIEKKTAILRTLKNRVYAYEHDLLF